MLVGFLGVPCSGKTTIAVKMFSSFKETNTNCELIVEQARQYIAQKRFNYKSNDWIDTPFELTDEDQRMIMQQQYKMESIMNYSCGIDTILISDSSTLNTGLYLSEESFNNFKDFFINQSKHYDLIFYCHPLLINNLPNDPNRIHNLEAIKSLEFRAKVILDLIKKANNCKVYELEGAMDLETKCNEAGLAVLDRHIEIIQAS